MGKRLFPDLRLILLRYAVIHLREMLGRAGIFLPDIVVHNSSGKNLRRWPGVELVILPVLQAILPNDTHTDVMPPTNYLFMKLTQEPLGRIYDPCGFASGLSDRKETVVYCGVFTKEVR